MGFDGDDPFGFRLLRPPPVRFERTGKGSASEAPEFDPKSPPASGWYSFAIDRDGAFRVESGRNRPHARLVKGRPVGAAGWFFVDGSGEISAVDCYSRDYRVAIPDERHRSAVYVLEIFRSATIRLSPRAVFQFSRSDLSRFRVSADGELIRPPDVRLFLASKGVEDADPTPLDPQSPFREQCDGFGERRALG